MGIAKIAILGGGQMGAGVAQIAAGAGIDVVMIKATPGPIDKARAGIESDLARQVERGKLEQGAMDALLARLVFTDQLDAVADCDLLLESIVENLEIKRAKFAEVDRLAGPQCILASNTSTLSITAMQSATNRPKRFIGVHFFNPATVMKLVEVVPTATTSRAVTASVIGFVERLGKTPVLVKDETGFIVNRLLTPYMLDAIRCLESGLADIRGIDTAMHLGANHPMGPLSLADYIGLDVVLAMSENLYATFKHDCMEPTDLLRHLVAEGVLGRKTKLGFYDYSQRPPAPNKALQKR
ncbi:MAG: 3-hydroxyacyl-CoA dehydrogenase family protein [Deltaproteobacteria bacterium]|nr:3-hydroxyacyl-CoA dehydrogenase family protein [Deltaproteobacteria bacterium]